jgi:hypothetical protein
MVVTSEPELNAASFGCGVRQLVQAFIKLDVGHPTVEYADESEPNQARAKSKTTLMYKTTRIGAAIHIKNA